MSAKSSTTELPQLVVRRRLAEEPAIAFLAQKYGVRVIIDSPPTVSRFADIHFSGITGTSVDVASRILYTGNPDSRNLTIGECAHEFCHLVGHPPWEEPTWSDEFVSVWALELALVEDLVRRGFYNHVDLLDYVNNHFGNYSTSTDRAISSFRPQTFSRALRRSRQVCYEAGLITKTHTPTYKEAKWDPALEDCWKELQLFDENDCLKEDKTMSSKRVVREELTPFLAGKIARKKGLNLDILEKSAKLNGSRLSGDLTKIPGDEGYVTLEAEDQDGSPTFWIRGLPIDISFVKASV